MNPLFYVSALALKTFPKYRQSPELKKSAETTLSIKASILGGAVTISKENLINEEIRDKEVRVIDSDGSMLGVMPIEQAMDLANERKLDLVNISPNAKPAVCKILDYGKYRYELQKKEKEAKKKQKTIDVKEVRLSPNIDTNDLNTKVNAARKFLSKGDRVKVTLRFRGREMAHMASSKHVLDDFAEHLADVAVVEKAPKIEGRSMTMFISAKPVK